MPQVITRDELQELVTRGAQLVEVLPAAEFEEEHLPGAVNIPLRQIDNQARAALDPQQPVIVYCWDVA
jgi:rhodanese-related sulfurtransferase